MIIAYDLTMITYPLETRVDAKGGYGIQVREVAIRVIVANPPYSH
jgi:hypothetical protein